MTIWQVARVAPIIWCSQFVLQSARAEIERIAPSNKAEREGRRDGPCKVIRDFLGQPSDPSVPDVLTGTVTLSGDRSGKIDFSLTKKEERIGILSCGEGSFQYLIALVPDPVNTHLSLTFDRTVESIQGAAITAGYEFEAHYYPWKSELGHLELDLDRRTAQEKEKEKLELNPGVLLFRNSNGPFGLDKCGQKACLAVFLVGETATSGVNQVQFSNALSYVGLQKEILENTCSESAPILIIGPNYSGAVPSLLQAIKNNGTRKYEVFNGSATNKKMLDKLSKGGCQTCNHPIVHNFIHSDSELMNQLLWSEPMKRGQIALLTEDETVFGSTALDENMDPSQKSRVHLIQFPRNISHFRNAVHVLPGVPAGATDNVPLLRQLLPFDPHQSEGQDSLPSLSVRTASAQQAVLSNITHELNLHRFSFVGIRATDPIDVVFLTRLVHETSPDIRTFVLDSDLLLVREAYEAPLTGMLNATTYPLVLANQRWTQPRDRTETMIAFPSRTAEALHNATVSALNLVSQLNYPEPLVSCGSSPLSQATHLIEYSSPTKDNYLYPPIWISVLSRSGYWPLAVIPSQSNFLDPKATPIGVGFSYQSPDRLWWLSAGVVCFCSLVYAAFVCFFNFKGTGNIPLWAETFWVNPQERGRAGRLSYLTARTLAIVTLNITISAPLLRFFGEGGPKLFIMMQLVVLFALVVAAILPIWLVLFKFAIPAASAVWQYAWLLAVAVFSSVGFCICWFLSLLRSHNFEGYFTAWRSLNLASGVSPSLPMLFGLSGIIWWCSMHRTRLILGSDRMPLLPEIWKSRFPNGIAGKTEILGLGVKQSANKSFYQWPFRASGAVIIFLFVLWDPSDNFRSVETSWVQFLLRSAVGTLASLLFLSWSRMIWVWRALSNFLVDLERHPIRQAFSDLPREKSWSPVMQRGTLKRTYLFETRALESAEAVMTLPPLTTWWLRAVASLRENIKNNSHVVASGIRLNSVQAQGTFTLIRFMSNELITHRLVQQWRTGSSESLAELPKAKREFNEEARLLVVCNEFVALSFVFFIRTALLQIRNLLFFVIGAYVLLVLSISSYPFQAPRTLAWAMTVSLAVLGGGVCWMLAQMARDSILSRLTDTSPGKLGADFFLKAAAAGVLPVLSLVASQFPSVSNFLLQWLQPTMQAVK